MTTVEAPAGYRFTPQNCIAVAVNVEFGKVDPNIVPSYHQLPQDAVHVVDALINLAVDPTSGVELVFSGSDEGLKNLYPETSRLMHRRGLSMIIGPQNLQELVGDVDGPSSYLWPRGEMTEQIH